MTNIKNNIIWVEDRPDGVYNEILLCKNKGFEVTVLSTTHRLMDILNMKKDNIALIIMDLMLYSVKSLDNIDISIYDSFTEEGYNAGWVIIDLLLRSKKIQKYMDIPILICSSRNIYRGDKELLDNIKNRGGSWIEYTQKDVCYKIIDEKLTNIKNNKIN